MINAILSMDTFDWRPIWYKQAFLFLWIRLKKETILPEEPLTKQFDAGNRTSVGLMQYDISINKFLQPVSIVDHVIWTKDLDNDLFYSLASAQHPLQRNNNHNIYKILYFLILHGGKI